MEKYLPFPFPQIYASIDSFAWEFGRKVDILKGSPETTDEYIETSLFVLCLWISFPLCFVYQFLNAPKVRLWYSIIVGVFLNFTCYRKNILHFLCMMTVTKLLLHYGDSHRITLMPKLIFFYNLAHLSCVHLYIMIFHYGYWGADLTAFTMVMICKMSSIGYLVQDGKKENQGSLTKSQIERSLARIPTWTELVAYVFNPMSCLAGPFAEISNFLDFVHKRGNYSKVPFSVLHPLKVLLAGFAFLGSNVLLNSRGFNPLRALEPDFINEPYWWKVIWLDIACLNIRFKYYAVWVK